MTEVISLHEFALRKSTAAIVASIAAELLLSVLLCSCRRAGVARVDNASQASPIPSVTPLRSPDAQLETSPPAIVTESPADIASVERSYLGAANADDKTDIIAQIADAGTNEAANALGRLLQNEPATELKLELLGAVAAFESDSPEKNAALAIGLWPSQPQEVRLFAIDALAASATTADIQLLETFRLDPDPEVRAEATDAIESAQEAAQPQD
jgi:hypothetical protein